MKMLSEGQLRALLKKVWREGYRRGNLEAGGKVDKDTVLLLDEGTTAARDKLVDRLVEES